ncbi:MAG: DegT/DnrJ/EryC1/StrS family aminotransferase [Candidatus Hydrogenedentes bacterium]|nr:DegT/DnrJ/EryC1/StrS family aminotransferase [Candidatus Hydrogenedentota bacterium]
MDAAAGAVRGRRPELYARYRLPEPVLVTRPTMPALAKYQEQIAGIWERQWLTNNGQLHQEFEARLAAYLEVEHLSLFCNGTIALLVALQALRIHEGEVITTPFTFPATVHVLYWNRIRPVFCDIDEYTFNLDPNCIERLIGPDTKAILPVHVFGYPCNIGAIQEIADRHGLDVIYDAAHAFGVRHRGQPLASYGDLSVLSFHATKLFSSIEGGAIVASTAAEKKRIDFLKNFGFADEETVIGPGINGKMNEFQAAYGLLELDLIDEEIVRRRALVELYRRELADVPGISFRLDLPETEHNYAYFPILVDASAYGMDRDALHTELKQFNIFTRKYFFPLCSTIPCYLSLPSADPKHLPVAERVSKRILCLPIYGRLAPETVQQICAVIKVLGKS